MQGQLQTQIETQTRFGEIMNIITHIKHVAQGKHPVTAVRSGHWPTVRKHHLESFPTCAVCGGSEALEVHHRRPFHLHPELELAPENLITLCESKKNGLNCHLAVGHVGSYRSFNETVTEDAAFLKAKLKSRPA